MNISLVLPAGMQLQDWADTTVLNLSGQGLVGSLQGDDWQLWATQLANIPALGSALPDPYAFTSWQDWAERLCGVLS